MLFMISRPKTTKTESGPGRRRAFERMWVFALLFSAASSISIGAGCRTDGRKNKGTEKPVGMESGPGKGVERAAPKPRLPRPSSLPAAGQDGRAVAFPKTIRVEPPAGHAGTLHEIEAKLAASSQRDRLEGARLLAALAVPDKQSVRLAWYLTMSKDPAMIRLGFRIWRRYKDHSLFVPVMASLMGHPDDHVRAQAVSLLTWGIRKNDIRSAAPFLRRLLSDGSCNVRHRALLALLAGRKHLSDQLNEVLIRVFDDPCPAVQALAVENLHIVVSPDTVTPTIAKSLLHRAERSPFHLVRCAAMLAMGRLGIRAGEKLMAAALHDARVPALTVYFNGGRLRHTYSIHSSMPACAAEALLLLGRRKGPARSIDRVRMLMKKYPSKDRYGPGAKDGLPGVLCLSSRDCKKDQICVSMECTPLDRAAKAYWRYMALKRCSKEAAGTRAAAGTRSSGTRSAAATKHKDEGWRNAGEPEAEQAGLGLHWMGPSKLRDHLRRKNPDSYRRKEKALAAQRCTRKDPS